MASERVEQLARKHPDAFESVATAKDDELREQMLRILDEQTGGQPAASD